MNELEQKLQDALNQVAVETLRADQAEQDLAKQRGRADAAEGARDSANARIAELEKARADAEDVDADKLKRQIQVQAAQIAALKTRADAAESQDRIRSLVKGRVELERKAAAVLGDKTRLDEMTDRQLMASVVERLHNVSLDGKSDDYVRARFDSAIEAHATGTAALERVREVVESRKPEQRSDSRSARQKFLEEQANAWKVAR